MPILLKIELSLDLSIGLYDVKFNLFRLRTDFLCLVSKNAQ